MNINEMIKLLKKEENKERELVLFDYNEGRLIQSKFFSLNQSANVHANTENLFVLIAQMEVEPIRTEVISCSECGGDCDMNTEYEGSAVCKDLKCTVHKD